ncbi:MAG TPA: hypothetical protein VLA02_01105 [Reyranella sp.]|nr:hypothetical protein [Reyranella sp.]
MKIDKGIALTGADQWATEVVPNPNKDIAFPVHGDLIGKNGADRKYQFVYIFLAGPDQRRDGIQRWPDRRDLNRNCFGSDTCSRGAWLQLRRLCASASLTKRFASRTIPA